MERTNDGTVEQLRFSKRPWEEELKTENNIKNMTEPLDHNLTDCVSKKDKEELNRVKKKFTDYGVHRRGSSQTIEVTD